MEEQLIAFETAKLAKEKGFDWESYKVFMKEDNEYKSIRCPLPENWNSLKNSKEAISRPTQSLLQKWLREVHNIQMFMKPYWDSSLNKGEFACDVIRIKDGKVIKSLRLNSYEEALEKGLQEALKLIQ